MSSIDEMPWILNFTLFRIRKFELLPNHASKQIQISIPRQRSFWKYMMLETNLQKLPNATRLIETWLIHSFKLLLLYLYTPTVDYYLIIIQPQHTNLNFRFRKAQLHL